MASCVENCRLCHESLPPKHRRTIFTETFGLTNQLIEVLGYIPRPEDGMSKYLCGFCFTKLNKLSKIEFDISHRLEALKNEKFELLKMLRARYVQIARPVVHSPRLSAEKQTCGTPRQETSKRPLFHSPTPRKVKKPLIFTPTENRMILPKTQRMEVQDDTKPEAKKKKVSVSLFSPGKAKVSYLLYPHKLRSMLYHSILVRETFIPIDTRNFFYKGLQNLECGCSFFLLKIFQTWRINNMACDILTIQSVAL